MRWMWLAAGLLGLAACRSDADRIDLALDIMARQVAPDVALTARPEDFRVQLADDVETYYVCGKAAVNGTPERVVVRVKWRKRGGLARFDGARSPEGKAEFEALWRGVCPA